MAGQAFSCPGCGAPLEIENAFSKVIICQYCGQSCAVSPKGLDPTGKVPLLADFFPVLKIGEKIRIGNNEGKVLGRLRYEYDDGFWDEWFVRTAAGKQIWLQEDEGLYTAYTKASLTSAVPDYASLKVGQTVSINGKDVFITEKGGAVIAGGQGELSFRFVPGERLRYVDGNCEGQLVSLELTDDEINLSLGEEVSVNSLGLDV